MAAFFFFLFEKRFLFPRRGNAAATLIRERREKGEEPVGKAGCTAGSTYSVPENGARLRRRRSGRDLDSQLRIELLSLAVYRSGQAEPTASVICPASYLARSAACPRAIIFSIFPRFRFAPEREFIFDAALLLCVYTVGVPLVL
jgi:hypothetical protein